MNKEIEEILKTDKVFYSFLKHCEYKEPLVFANTVNCSLDNIFNISLSPIEKKLVERRADKLYLKVYYLYKMIGDVLSSEECINLSETSLTLNKDNNSCFIHADARANSNLFYTPLDIEHETILYDDVWAILSTGNLSKAISYCSEVDRSDYASLLHGARSDDPVQLTNWALIAKSLVESTSNDSERYIMSTLSGSISTLENVLSPLQYLYFSLWSIILSVISDDKLPSSVRLWQQLSYAVNTVSIPFNIRLAIAHVSNDFDSICSQNLTAEELSLVISAFLYRKELDLEVSYSNLSTLCKKFIDARLSAKSLFTCAPYLPADSVYSSLVRLFEEADLNEQTNLIDSAVEANISNEIIFSALVSYVNNNSHSVEALNLLSCHSFSRFAFLCNVLINVYEQILNSDYSEALRYAELIFKLNSPDSLSMYKNLPTDELYNLAYGTISYLRGRLQLQDKIATSTADDIFAKYFEFLSSVNASGLMSMLNPEAEEYISICTGVDHPFPLFFGLVSIVLSNISTDMAVIVKQHAQKLSKNAAEFFRNVSNDFELLSILKDVDREIMVNSFLEIGRMQYVDV